MQRLLSKTIANIRFKAKLLRPADARVGSWSFLILPKQVSAKLPTRGQTTVKASINGHPFRATLEPDGQKGHWFKVTSKMRAAAAVEAGERVALEILSTDAKSEASVPADLRKALAALPQARTVWSDITPAARRDWIHWIKSAARSETRARRIHNACEMLAAGKRRVCCFDRSGFYSKSFCAPKAAD